MCWKVLGWTFGEIEGVKVYLKIPMGNCRQEEELSPGSKQRPHLRFCPFLVGFDDELARKQF